MCTKELNPLLEEAELVTGDEDYDVNQEIARSAFADMLHDTERNNAYLAGIKAAVEKVHQSGRKATVLDIGTGTGLLAMMAARCGADTIYACETFSPISKCAEQVIAENGFSNRITVIHKHSTKVTVGQDGDIPYRVNILVTEVFDTEIIGEGALMTFNHAHRHLLEEDCIVVPSSGTIYAQVVESEVLRRLNWLSPWGDIKPSMSVDECPGVACVHDLQLSQVSPNQFKEIVPPLAVFRFDFTNDKCISENDASYITVEAVASGRTDIVFMWFSLNMDFLGNVVLSCAPWWAHPSQPEGPNALPWRDHWMQGIYFLPRPLQATKGQKLDLQSRHDDYSWWFNIAPKDQSMIPYAPECQCHLHLLCSRQRIGMINDPGRRDKYKRILERLVTPESTVLSLGECSLLGLMAHSLGAKHVYHIEESSIARRRIMIEMICHNGLQDKVTVLEPSEIDDKVRSSVNLVVGEPWFKNTLVPWDALHFWFLRSQVPHAISSPVAATLHALPMQFFHLHKIRAPVGNVNGFKMAPFDELIQGASEKADSPVEISPLWEYPGVCLSEPQEIFSFDLTKLPPTTEIKSQGHIEITVPGTCHGVALWLDTHLDPDNELIVSTGPQQRPVPGKQVIWDPYSRQGVYFLRPEQPLQVHDLIQYTAVFSPTSTSTEVIFNFDIWREINVSI